MAYVDFKNLSRRIASGKGLRDEAFNIAENPKHNGSQIQWSTKFFIKSLPVVLLHEHSQRPQLRELRKINLLSKVKLFQINN